MKSWLIVLLPIIVFGALIGAGVMKVPGINDKPAAKKVAKKAVPDVAAPVDAAVVAPAITPTQEAPKPAPDAKPEAPKATIDLNKGNARLAKLWNDMDAAALSGIVEKWKDEDLAQVLAVMDNAKVVELLGKMKPERASALSRELQKLASIVPPAPAAG